MSVPHGWWLLPREPARSQGATDQCTAYATVAGMESWILNQRPELRNRLPLSEADLFSLVKPPRHAVVPALKVARDYGIVEAGAPAERAGMRAGERRKARDRFWRIRYSHILDAPTPAGKHRLMIKALEKGRPLVTSIYVDSRFRQHSGDGAYVLKQPPLPQAHAICIVGYDSARQTWIAKNSMGAAWGAADGCFAFPFGDRDLGAEDLVWQIEEVIPPSHF